MNEPLHRIKMTSAFKYVWIPHLLPCDCGSQQLWEGVAMGHSHKHSPRTLRLVQSPRGRMGLKQFTEDRTELEKKALHHTQWHPMHVSIASHWDPPPVIKKTTTKNTIRKQKYQCHQM